MHNIFHTSNHIKKQDRARKNSSKKDEIESAINHTNGKILKSDSGSLPQLETVHTSNVLLGGSSPIRIFVKRKPSKAGKDPYQSTKGKVLNIQPDWTYDRLIQKIGAKFDLNVTDVYLVDESSNDLLEIDDIDEIREGDTLLVDGIKLDDEGVDDHGLNLIHQTNSGENAVNHNGTAEFNRLNDNLSRLSNSLARLVARLDTQAESVENVAKLLLANSEQSKQQFAELATILAGANLKRRPEQTPLARVSAPALPVQPMQGTTMLEFQQVKVFTDHAGPIWALKVTSDLLISGSSDKTIRVWDLSTFKLVKTLEGHTGIVHCLAVSKGRLVSGSDDKSIRVWSLNDWRCINALYAHDNTVNSLITTDNYLLSGSFNLVHVWNIDTFQFITTLTGYNHWVYSLCLYEDCLYSGSHNLIKVWDLESLKCTKTVSTKSGKSIYSLAIAGNYLLSATYDNTIFVWNPKTMEQLRTLSQHEACVLCLSVSGPFFFSGSYDTTVKVWSLDNFQVVDTLHHMGKVEALLATDKYIVSGGTDNTIKVWRWVKSNQKLPAAI